MPQNPKNQVGRVKKRRGRPRPLLPHVNARNLATEKRRREELNEDLVSLARLLPGLANARRLSKVSIIQESARHLRQQRDVCLSAARELEELVAENSRLVSQLNALSATGWGSLLPNATQRPITEPMLRLMAVRDEVYGTFPAGFGDNWAHNASQPSNDINGATQAMAGSTGSSPDQLSTPFSQEVNGALAPGPVVIGHGGHPTTYSIGTSGYTESKSTANTDNNSATLSTSLPANSVVIPSGYMADFTWGDMLDQSPSALEMVLPSCLDDSWTNNLYVSTGDYPHNLGAEIFGG
ncbi:hypothetical protein BDW69DRAFT_186648 [Aspergillus filifer]